MIASTTVKAIGPMIPPEDVLGSGSAPEPIVANAADDPVVRSRPTRDEVVAQASVSEVAIAAAGVDPVVATVAKDEIAPSAG